MKFGDKIDWRVGDLCHRAAHRGCIYRVKAVNNSVFPNDYDRWTLVLDYVHGLFTEPGQGTWIHAMASECTKLTLVDIATEYAKLGLFISEEAKRMGSDDV